MKNSLLGIGIPAFVAFAAVLVLTLWVELQLVEPLEARVPGLDRPEGIPVEVERPLIGTLTLGDGVPAKIPGSWPRFRGENFDAIARPEVRLARSWPEAGPEKLWTIDVGQGYAAAAIRDGRVYLLDYDEEALGDAVRCLSLADGKEIWRYSYPVRIKFYHGMSRTIPAVTDKYLLSFGPKCHISCLNPVTGEEYWLIDLVKDFGAKVPQWYAGQCPLIDGDLAILAPGGDSLIVAQDCATGDVEWKTPNPRKWVMTHTSIMPMEFAGRKTYVYCGKGGVVGISADDGSILWETTDWKIGIATSPSPLVLPEGKIFFCGGYKAGALMLQLEEKDGQITATTLRRFKPKEFDSIQQTPILYEGHIYAVRGSDEQLVCLDLEGNPVWTSGSANKFGLGPYMIADGLIYVMSNEGVLTLVEATPSGYQQLAQADIFPHGHEAWGPMAMVNGRLIVRDFTQMACLDVAEK